ncbi:hypothetical protein NV379_02725 [Paenibacillus sp. N1-5-1-14]|uniref:hypothetical protein n=1 Tax=Paenibacillus radicibacter TaxID=2972488 RepID=UPI0021599B23|nr:hypothetical protein [Paenibacillus radicibacter]MCR8641561.1 hypothetical protein [Paenibacillus radicibacter]
MPLLQTYDHFNDPLKIVWRSGKADDPYIPRSDFLPIINGRITLLEIPAKEQRVKISGFTEINQDVYERHNTLQPYEFLVDYNVGDIHFHPSNEGKSLMCESFGRGIILYPASRIYALVERSPDIVKTLQDIIDEALQRLKDTELAIGLLNQVIEKANTATNNANIATDNAKQATFETLMAIKAALNAAASTIMIYKDPVSNFKDIKTKYPLPENGWRVMVSETGDIYRFDGVITGQWQLIDNYLGGSIPFASETTSGLLKSDNYKDFIFRRVLFLMPSVQRSGVQGYLVQFPHNGEITKVSGYCTQAGSNQLKLHIEKNSEKDFSDNEKWTSIFSKELVFSPNSLKSNDPVFINKQVAKGDYFRINLSELDYNFKGITIQIDIKIK